jgi:hypothetical protein
MAAHMTETKPSAETLRIRFTKRDIAGVTLPPDKDEQIAHAKAVRGQINIPGAICPIRYV